MDFYQSDSYGRDFKRLAEQTSSQIQQISKNVNTIQRMVGQLGTPQDNDDLRQKLHEIQHNTRTLSQTTMESLKQLKASVASFPPSATSEQTRQWKLQEERLRNEFATVLNNFQSSQRATAQKEKASVSRARAESGIGGRSPFDEVVAPGQQQQALQIEQNVDIETLKEREQTIIQLESDIVSVNQIFKELALIVHEQGETIDSIEAHIDRATVNVQQGATDIQRASQYQSKVRRKRFLCIIFLIILIIVVSIIIYFSVKS